MEELVIHKGESRDIVLLNPQSQDLLIRQQADSCLRLCVVAIGVPSLDLTLHVEQEEEGAQTELYGLVVAMGSEKNHIRTIVNHDVPHGQSQQLFKYVLSGKAEGHFTGQLRVAQDAQKTDAFQTNRNIVLSDTATMRTMPQLEIYADDVHCSHGASTGQLDETAIFYMQQRGIAPETAKRLLLEAFCGEVVEHIGDAKKRDEVSSLLKEHL